MPDYKWKRVKDPDDPRRCQATMSTGQCWNKAIEDSNYCAAHGGNKGQEKAKKNRLRNYRLSKFHAQAKQFSDSDEILSLRDEIALMRMMAQERLEQCENEYDLCLAAQPLGDMFMKVEKLVASCERIEHRLGAHLDKSKIILAAQIMIDIIGKYIQDETILEKIAEELQTNLGDL